MMNLFHFVTVPAASDHAGTVCPVVYLHFRGNEILSCRYKNRIGRATEEIKVNEGN